MVNSYLLLVHLLTMSAVCNALAVPAGETETTPDLTSAAPDDRDSKRVLYGLGDSNEHAPEERMALGGWEEAGASTGKVVEEALDKKKTIWSKVKSMLSNLKQQYKQDRIIQERESKEWHKANLRKNAIFTARDEEGNLVQVPAPPQPHLE
ncbi:unnamed protein product [Hyaloperonospora brassicae]|uniref:RxLR effector candidate protein n=1 Tax=Hyaloperonospora brassicae TaxID=162125 RepID=A0AAV0TB68_HYABA|nr:unnamed protein product [Hyaloperonospora brassicae]